MNGNGVNGNGGYETFLDFPDDAPTYDLWDVRPDVASEAYPATPEFPEDIAPHEGVTYQEAPPNSEIFEEPPVNQPGGGTEDYGSLFRNVSNFLQPVARAVGGAVGNAIVGGPSIPQGAGPQRVTPNVISSNLTPGSYRSVPSRPFPLPSWLGGGAFTGNPMVLLTVILAGVAVFFLVKR